MPQSFTNKIIEVSVTLGKGTFSESGNSKIMVGLPCEISVTKPGLPEKNSASISIWGLSYESMAQLTMLAFKPLHSHLNIITVKAGYVGEALSLVFKGEITSAYANFNQSPDPCMVFEASTGAYPHQLAQSPLTVKGEAKADQLFAKFSQASDYSYKNEGVKSSVKNACFSGSPIDKMTKLSRDIGCELMLDDGEVIVMPEGSARKGRVVVLQDSTGLIGYPTFTQQGIACSCFYTPELQYGGLITIKSLVPRASGTWRISKLSHNLSAYISGGNWESHIEAHMYD